MNLPDAPLAALWLPFEQGDVAWPADGRLLFLGARDGPALRAHWRPSWVCTQDARPQAQALERLGAELRQPREGERFEVVCVLPPRQRDEARALLARGLRHLAPGGTLVASVANTGGASALQGDLAHLAGPPRHLAKHKCRVFRVSPDAAMIDEALLEAWLARDAVQPIEGGAWLSRPGLFAWDRVDRASALLAAQLPPTLAGRVADLGAGYGYLSAQVLVRCPQVTAIDLYEAQARALEPARRNLQRARATHGADVTVEILWHDVTEGLPRRYDAIVSNPPFHQGRADAPQLGQAFITAAARALQPPGTFYMVANRHLPYEVTLRTHFAELSELAAADGYKVFAARGARA
ncbi:MAG TPA: methyltransferase [Rhodanobacteraceae bacterium]|nr:methyltransferase [Rhodanobacteraceae bacterium]